MDSLGHLIRQPSHQFSATVGDGGTLHQGDVYNIFNNSTDPRKLLKWLPNLHFGDSLRHHADKQLTGTGLWLLGQSFYLRWLENRLGRDRVLWCHGDPGVGKTVLCSMVVNHLQTLDDPQQSPVLYIFFDYAKRTEQTPAAVFGDLIRRLIQHNLEVLGPELQKMHKRAECGERQLSMGELQSLFGKACESFEGLTIVMDGLDEADQRCLETIFAAFNYSQTKNLALFLVGRERPHPREFLRCGNLDVLDITIRTDVEDVSSYLKQEVSNLSTLESVLATIDTGSHAELYHPHAKCSATTTEVCLRNHLLKQLVEKTKFSFLAAELCLNQLRDVMCEADLANILERDTLDYQNLYDRTFIRIRNQSPAEKMLALRAMSWVAKAKRPLLANELCHALAMQYSGRTFSKTQVRPINIIQRACLGLLTVKIEVSAKERRSPGVELSSDEERSPSVDPLLKQESRVHRNPGDDTGRGTVRFIHSTLLEYLEKNEIIEIGDKDIINTCWQYVSMPDLQSALKASLPHYFASDLPARGFLDHQFERYPFGSYALEYWKQHVDKSIQQWPELLEYLYQTHTWLIWIHIRSAPERDSVFQNKDWYRVREPLSMVRDQEWLDSHALACLALSISHDWTFILQCLLASSMCGLPKIYKHLHVLTTIAIQVGRLGCLQQLLEAYRFLVSAHSSLTSNLVSEQQTQLTTPENLYLFKVSAETADAMPPLQDQMVESLIDSRTSWYRLVSSFAQFQAIYDALNDCGIDCSSTNTMKETLLHVVAHNGDKPYIIQDAEFATAVQDSDTERIGRVFRLLLNSGADPNLCDSEGFTPLHIMLRNIFADEITSLVLDNGADVNIRDEFGSTVLHLAVMNHQSADVIDMIIAHGGDVNAQDNEGRTALHRALWMNRTITDHLLDHGAQNLPDVDGTTALHILMQWNFASNLFLRLGSRIADINVLDGRGNTPILVLAACFDYQSTYGRRTKAGFLLRHESTNLNAQNMFSNTALHIAVKRYLLSFEHYQPTPSDELVVVSEKKSLSDSDRIDYLDFIRQLVDRNANVNMPDAQGDTIAHLATRHPPRKELIEAIGSQAIDLETQNVSGVSVRTQIAALPTLTQPWVVALLLRKHWYDNKGKRWHIAGNEEHQLAAPAFKKLRGG